MSSPDTYQVRCSACKYESDLLPFASALWVALSHQQHQSPIDGECYSATEIIDTADPDPVNN